MPLWVLWEVSVQSQVLAITFHLVICPYWNFSHILTRYFPCSPESLLELSCSHGSLGELSVKSRLLTRNFHASPGPYGNICAVLGP